MQAWEEDDRKSSRFLQIVRLVLILISKSSFIFGDERTVDIILWALLSNKESKALVGRFTSCIDCLNKRAWNQHDFCQSDIVAAGASLDDSVSQWYTAAPIVSNADERVHVVGTYWHSLGNSMRTRVNLKFSTRVHYGHLRKVVCEELIGQQISGIHFRVWGGSDRQGNGMKP